MKKLLTTFSLLFLGIFLYGQMNNIEFQEYTLDNGLHVILHKDNSTPIVSVSVMYHVGSKNENPERTGFAHFFEHLLFEGSENIERGEYSRYVEEAGGTLNANTSYDRTFYYETLPSNQLELGLWLESERMLHAKVDKKGIETQREIIKEEKLQTMDNRPYGKLLMETMNKAFKLHPYKWPIIGSLDHLNAAQEIDYINFYKTFYVPENAVLSIAGDIDYEETKNLVEKYFNTIPKGKGDIPRPNIVEPPLTGETIDTVYDNIQLPAVVLGYRIPAQGTPDYYALTMLGQLLSQGQSSRLHKAMVDDQQKALGVGSFPLPLEDPGLNLTFGIVNMGVDPAELISGMTEVIKLTRDELVSDEEFQKLKNQVENDFISSNSSVAGIAESLANYHIHYGDANLINTELERYLRVTKEDIRKVAQKYFHNGNRIVLYYLPQPVTP